MARIIIGSYMARYPLGGMMSWVLQYLVGFQRLGYEVYFVERCTYPNACYNPMSNELTDDVSYGTKVLNQLLSEFGLGKNWCVVDINGRYHGLDKNRIESLFANAALYIDMGVHGAWNEEAQVAEQTVLADGEPGFTQIKMELRREQGKPIPEYDHHYTAGVNLATGTAIAPTAGKQWKALPHPVVTELFQVEHPPPDAPFTTIMNWQSHKPIVYQGKEYGQKDKEFVKFIKLPQEIAQPIELAVSGKNVPREQLMDYGWRLRDAKEVTISYDSFKDYIYQSFGEFSVCKEVFVVNKTGWFSDRSAAYLASGRPVIQQDTGFGEHLPTGEGLFAVDSVASAAEAIKKIKSNYAFHSLKARNIAKEYLDSRIVLTRFLAELGVR